MKKELEQAYDIPFDVRKSGDEYIIWPSNDMEEYFTIRVSFRSGVRIILEIEPQRHAADMLRDMSKASEEKKNLFFGYMDLFMKRGFHQTVLINGSQTDLHKLWPDTWKNLSIRLTKIEDQEADFEHDAVSNAVPAAGMMLSLLNVVSTDDTEQNSYEDGARKSVTYDRFERNRLNRQLCLEANGYTCKICGLSFEKKYGEIGRRFIHVHHIQQLSLAGGPVKIDPVHDLIPVCPNCHAMLHRRTPPLMPDELRKIIKETEKENREAGND